MRLLFFLLAYRASTHDTMGLTPAIFVFGRELCMPCNMLFTVPPNIERATIDHAADVVDRLHLKLASDGMKTRYDHWPAWATKTDC
jgi:hypothetical protein